MTDNWFLNKNVLKNSIPRITLLDFCLGWYSSFMHIFQLQNLNAKFFVLRIWSVFSEKWKSHVLTSIKKCLKLIKICHKLSFWHFYEMWKVGLTSFAKVCSPAYWFFKKIVQKFFSFKQPTWYIMYILYLPHDNFRFVSNDCEDILKFLWINYFVRRVQLPYLQLVNLIFWRLLAHILCLFCIR